LKSKQEHLTVTLLCHVTLTMSRVTSRTWHTTTYFFAKKRN